MFLMLDAHQLILLKKTNFNKFVNLKKYGFGIGPRVDIKNKYYVVLLHPNTEKKSTKS